MSGVLLVVCAVVVSTVVAACGPTLVRRLPEPVLASDRSGKVPYVELGARPHLAVYLGLAGLVVGTVVALSLGGQPVLVAWAYLAGLGVTLAYVDARTRLLPTRLVAPSYAVVVALILLAGLVDGDGGAVLHAGLGWLVMGGFYFALWFIYPRGLGYGDVRLSGLLGLALGYVGWGPLVTGMYAGFLLGGVGGIVLAMSGMADRKAFPFGPFMLVGAATGLVWGEGLSSWYGSF